VNGIIPVLSVVGRTLAEMWENSVIELWENGCRIRTEYDAKDAVGNYVHPASVDCTMMMSCPTPDAEPALHRCFPGGLGDLEEYRLEVTEGLKDHWLREPDPTGTKWKYTYHDRLRNYPVHDKLDGAAVYGPFDQLKDMAEKLAKSPHSRRVQGVTWIVGEDAFISDPPCLQSVWARVLPDENDVWHLNLNVRFRSRDAYEAAFMNVWGFAGKQGLQGQLARMISEIAGREVRCGHYCDVSDSYHIYGSVQDKFKREFLIGLERPEADRRWSREDMQEVFDEGAAAARAKVAKRAAEMDAKG
jgi:thymidylate synthase